MEHNRKYRLIGQKLIRMLDEFKEIREADVKIAYLSCDKEKKQNRKIVFAECCKVDEKYKWTCQYDFFIVVYEPNVAEFSDQQLEILIRHELHHVGVEYTDKGISFYIVPHDVEEFWDIIREHGLNWSDVYAAR